MFSFFEGASLKIAKYLIQVTGVQKTFTLFYKKNLSNITAEDAFKIILALNATNLIQTMKEDFISREIDQEDSQDIVEDYITENLRQSGLTKVLDGAELMERCIEITGISEKLRVHWMGEEDQHGPDPYYYCVMDVLRRLGNEGNHELQDTLFEFMNFQHKHFTHYFKTLLEPLGNSSSDSGPNVPNPSS